MNLFIAGVGNVELFKGRESVLVSKTLVDSSINLSVSLEDIRAGAGAKLYGKYAHTSTMTMKLTDAMFRMDFLAHNIGSDLLDGGDAVAVVSKTTGANGSVDLSDIVAQPILEGEPAYVWISKKGYEDFIVFPYASTITTTDFGANVDVCVRYLKKNDAGSHIKVSANFIPDTLTAILTAPLFAGDESNLESSTKVGTLTITIPRFMLNGTTDLSMTMTGASQMALEGSALAVNDYDCENNDGYYAVINKVITNANWYDGLKKYIGEALSIAKGSSASATVYGIFDNGARKLMKESQVSLSTEATGVTINGLKISVSSEATAGSAAITMNLPSGVTIEGFDSTTFTVTITA